MNCCNVKACVINPITPARATPLPSKIKTLMPIKAPTKIHKYGTTFNHSIWYTASSVTSYCEVNASKIIRAKIAAGKTIKKLTLNLSLNSHPCVLTAAIVVSEIIDKLSPNIPPPTMAPTTSATSIPVACATPSPTGVKAVIVPTDVPIETEINPAIMNSPTTTKWGGSNDKLNCTVASTPPIALATPENAPANKKIMTIIIILSWPAPLQNIPTFSWNDCWRFMTNAAIDENKNATRTGIE